eukprot:scaffold14220_cov151-Skeletonema_dohrnii-CCMP3373.AAC.1
MEEMEDAPTPTPNVKRRRKSREAASLKSELGEYWAAPSRPTRGGRPRRGGRQPVPTECMGREMLYLSVWIRCDDLPMHVAIEPPLTCSAEARVGCL